MVLGLLACLLAACGPSYDGVRIGEVSYPPESANVLVSGITLATGTAVRATIVPVDDDGELYTEEGAMTLGTTDPYVFDVRQMDEADRWLLIAGLPGTAKLLVSLGGLVVQEIRVTVRDQAPPASPTE
jgi:hypothetical protein